MYPEDLKEFIGLLDRQGLVHRISCCVDSKLEIAAIVDRVCKSHAKNKALFFDNVRGFSVPVVANLFGSIERMQIALATESINQLADRIKSDLSVKQTTSSTEALFNLVTAYENQKKPAEEARWHAVDISAAGLDGLPILKSWPGDGGRYLTLGMVFSMTPDGTKSNCGIYRVQMVDSHTALLRCHSGSGGSDHIKAWHEMNKTMPVAIVLGGPPALTWAAGVSLPEEISEVNYIRYLTGKSLPMVDCCLSQLQVPANAEIVIEGEITPGDFLLEGPFGNHTGLYAQQMPAPVVRVKSVKMADKAIYPCTVVGPPPMENGFMATVAVRLMLPLLQYDHPWVKDVHFPVEGIYHRAAMVSIARNTDIEVEEIEQALLSSRLLKNSRLLILLDEGVDLGVMRQVYWHVVNKMNCHKAETGILVDARTSGNRAAVEQDAGIIALVDQRWKSYGFSATLEKEI